MHDMQVGSEFTILKLLAIRQSIHIPKVSVIVIFRKFCPLGHVIHAHDPNRSDKDRPTGPGPMTRIVNHLPIRQAVLPIKPRPKLDLIEAKVIKFKRH